MATGHGFEFEFGDGVDFVDARAEGRPAVHFSDDEFNAFVAGVRAGEFDFDECEDGEEAAER
jgi:hypothetical protein